MFLFTTAYSQPTSIRGEGFNTTIAFKSDTGVKINNDIFIGGHGAGVYKKQEKFYLPYCENCKECPEPSCLCYFLICNPEFYYQIPIIKSNTVSIYMDSLFCDLSIQLIRGKDTMNITLKNIIYGQTHLSIFEHRHIAYVIHYIPFKQGDFTIKINKPDNNFTYKEIYNRTEFPCDFCPTEFWDITPDNWKRIKN